MVQIERRPDESKEELWARVDPYNDRLSRDLPCWSCVIFVAMLLAFFVAASRLLT